MALRSGRRNQHKDSLREGSYWSHASYDRDPADCRWDNADVQVRRSYGRELVPTLSPRRTSCGAAHAPMCCPDHLFDRSVHRITNSLPLSPVLPPLDSTLTPQPNYPEPTKSVLNCLANPSHPTPRAVLPPHSLSPPCRVSRSSRRPCRPHSGSRRRMNDGLPGGRLRMSRKGGIYPGRAGRRARRRPGGVTWVSWRWRCWSEGFRR